MKRIVYLVRHGDVENPRGVIYGQLPGFGLSEQGRAEARSAGTYLLGRDVGKVIVSPMLRTCQTAEILCDVIKRDFTVDPRLTEIHSPLEGKKWLNAMLPHNLLRWARRREPDGVVADRLVAALGDALGGHQREVVLVSHGGCILVLAHALRDRRVPTWAHLGVCPTGSITTLAIDDSSLPVSSSEARYA